MFKHTKEAREAGDVATGVAENDVTVDKTDLVWGSTGSRIWALLLTLLRRFEDFWEEEGCDLLPQWKGLKLSGRIRLHSVFVRLAHLSLADPWHGAGVKVYTEKQCLAFPQLSGDRAVPAGLAP